MKIFKDLEEQLEVNKTFYHKEEKILEEQVDELFDDIAKMMITSCQKFKEIAKENLSKSFKGANQKVLDIGGQIDFAKKNCVESKSKMVDALMRLANDIKTNKCNSVENVFPTDLC